MNRPHAIVIGASSGGVAALLELAAALPKELNAVVGMVLHVGSRHRKSTSPNRCATAAMKSIVELHGGRIEAFSAGLGKGSEFRVMLPAARQHIRQARP